MRLDLEPYYGEVVVKSNPSSNGFFHVWNFQNTVMFWGHIAVKLLIMAILDIMTALKNIHSTFKLISYMQK